MCDNGGMSPELFQNACASFLGAEWHRAIARELGPHHPNGPRPQIDDRLVRRWAAGEREIPIWVAIALLKIIAARAGSYRRAAARLDTVGDALRASLDENIHEIDVEIPGR